MQSPIPNLPTRPRQESTQSYTILQKFVRARVPFVHARTRAHEELAQERVHGAPRAPTRNSPHPHHFPLPNHTTPTPKPRHTRTCPRHSRTPFVIPAKAGIQRSPINNLQSAINNSPHVIPAKAGIQTPRLLTDAAG